MIAISAKVKHFAKVTGYTKDKGQKHATMFFDGRKLLLSRYVATLSVVVESCIGTLKYCTMYGYIAQVPHIFICPDPNASNG